MSFVPDGWQASSSELAGKTVLITGANRGIGEAVALSCAQHGAEVLLLGRDEAALARVYDQIIELGARRPASFHWTSPPATPSLYARWQMNSPRPMCA
jgi:NAD(P)-dependent dehydrogenase (short-subunit alcohol dehydrogenase family)